MSRIRVAGVIALAATAISGVDARAGDPEDHSGQALEAAMTRLVQMRSGPPGVAAVVQHGGRREYHAAGVRNLRTRQRWRAKDHMRIASVSKAFSGAVALSLVERGKLRLSDTIADLLPELPTAWAPVTLRQALHHTSGLPDYTQTKAFRDSLTENPRKHLTRRDVIDFVRGKPLDFTPGSRYQYSNTDNFVVAMMARAVRGRSYVTLLRSKVFRPLRLRRTTLPSGFRLPRPLTHGYVIDPPDPAADISEAISASGAWASGGLQSNPAELNRFVRGYVGRKLFGRATQRRQFRFVKGSSDPPGPGRNSAGLGIFRYRTRCGTVYGHTGGFPGYTQFTAATQDGRRSVTVSVNEQLAPDSPRRAIRAAFKALRKVETLAVCAALAQRG
jgi:D-alanyl-D-alanine carboxypeptidase